MTWGCLRNVLSCGIPLFWITFCQGPGKAGKHQIPRCKNRTWQPSFRSSLCGIVDISQLPNESHKILLRFCIYKRHKYTIHARPKTHIEPENWPLGMKIWFFSRFFGVCFRAWSPYRKRSPRSQLQFGPCYSDVQEVQTCQCQNELVVLTRWNSGSQNGSFPLVAVKIKNETTGKRKWAVYESLWTAVCYMNQNETPNRKSSIFQNEGDLIQTTDEP